MISKKILNITRSLIKEVSLLKFSQPVYRIYNPLEYAWKPYRTYIEKYASSKKKVIFLGMNPGPWGMAQVGVPFGEISYVRDWLRIEEKIDMPKNPHPKRPVKGFSCSKSEVSGRRLWGLFKDRYGKPENFFGDHLVLNYCPLVFMGESGKNITPDKLKKKEKEILFQICDEHIKRSAEILEPEWLIGIGNFSEIRIRAALKESKINIGKILHPSPASPAANKDWAGNVTKQLKLLKVWK